FRRWQIPDLRNAFPRFTRRNFMALIYWPGKDRQQINSLHIRAAAQQIQQSPQPYYQKKKLSVSRSSGHSNNKNLRATSFLNTAFATWSKKQHSFEPDGPL